MLVGREGERAAIDEVLHRVRSGQGQGVAISGEPGIGKSALLEYTAERAGGMRVLRTSGVEPESDIGFATLHRLVMPVLDRIAQIPKPQAQALEIVLGEAIGPPPDRFLVALAALSLLAEAATEQPLLCLVDDAHWADGPSLDTITFVARRIAAEPIAVVLAARTGEGRPLSVEGLVDIPVAGLDLTAVRELLGSQGCDELSADEQEQVLAATGGNPLAIREAPESVMDGVDLREPMALKAGLQDAFLRRVRTRGTAVQRLLPLVAAEGSGRIDTVRRAAASIGLGDDPLASDELDDLIVQDGTRVWFRHPLIRSAVYHGATSAERRAAHRALAGALDDDGRDLERRAWHLGRAAEGPDEKAAEALERSAERALTRAGPAGAAAALTRAAELSASEEDQGRRLLAAATAALQAGDTARVTELLDRAERCTGLGPSFEPKIAASRAFIEVLAGTPTDALPLLRQAMPPARQENLREALPLLLQAGELGFRANRADVWVDNAAWLEQLPLDGADPDQLLARLLRGASRARVGVDPGLHPGDQDAIEHLTDPISLIRAAGLTWAFGDYELGRRLRHKGARRTRAQGAAGTLAWALEYLVYDELARNRFGMAEAYAEEGHRFALETGQPNTACRHRSWLAVVAALRGRAEEATQRAYDVLVEANERRLDDAAAAAYCALGLLDLVAGRSAEALKHFEAMHRDETTSQSGIVLSTIPELVEAAVRSGQMDRAVEAFGRFSTWVEVTRSPELHALAGRCKALLASADDGEAAESAFVESLALHAKTERPMDHAHTALLFGQHLRRARRRADARPHLRAALETFRRIGALAWAERAEDELRATGETHAPLEQSNLAQLTPQELRVAMAVSEGATNREIAARLFLSPRTIDYHLRKVFQKVQIGSRAELIKLVVAELGEPVEPVEPVDNRNP